MSKHFALDFTDLPAVVIYEAEKYNNWGSWQDFIVVEKESDSLFSVYGRKYADKFVDGGSEQVWEQIFSSSLISEPKDFIKAVSDCEFELSVDVFWDEVLEKLSQLNSKFSSSVAKELLD